MNRVCTQCRGGFETIYPTKKYCSGQCERNSKRSRRRKKHDKQFLCEQCGKEFWRSKDMGHAYKFCSKSCSAFARVSKAPGTYTRLYFILCVLTQRVKIGISDGVDYRFTQLRAQNADELRMLGTIPGSFKLEQDIHKELSAHHVHHEFFDFTAPEVKKLIDRYLYPEAGDPIEVPESGRTDGPPLSVSEQESVASLRLCANPAHTHDYVSGPDCFEYEKQV